MKQVKIDVSALEKLEEAERQRDAYAAEIRRFLDAATDFAESRHDFLRFLRLADDIEERLPEFREPSQPR